MARMIRVSRRVEPTYWAEDLGLCLGSLGYTLGVHLLVVAEVVA